MKISKKIYNIKIDGMKICVVSKAYVHNIMRSIKSQMFSIIYILYIIYNKRLLIALSQNLENPYFSP
jgi:hypothetical protein